MSFADALVENRIPPRVGDVRLRYDEGRMLGESLPPPLGRRVLPELCLLLAACCGLGSILLLVAVPGTYVVPGVLALGAAAFLGFGFQLEARHGRRRFVLHFHTETLRLERLTWAPRATRTEVIPFDDVTAVEVVERSSGHYAILVVWRAGDEERRAVLVEHARPSEAQTLHRVWRMLHNAFGLKALAPE
ncbi:hypothetical protein [Hyalangium rubrum]|uniref:Lipoprotein n=1 Tax=Hyalangium rubrum TaxID=3103134 RepID=A0ABU5GWX0_9BACT|nr:hypothetical protein [Hyalangium sp. s54d21]MDY7225194.1 hypothetical protein [Hyalangium sp. s54d21]